MQEPFHTINNVNNETVLTLPERVVLVKRLLEALLTPPVGDGYRNRNDARDSVHAKTAGEVITEAHLIDVLSNKACAFRLYSPLRPSCNSTTLEPDRTSCALLPSL